jgi:CelD/BcsL family acetyltransferase involved in cellulose biosynthesis
MAEALDIRVVDRPEAVRPAWTELEAEGLCLPFQRYLWAERWCAALAPALGAQPAIALVSCAAAPVLLLPLCVVRRGPVRSLEFMDGGLSDYNAPVLSAPAARLGAPAFAALFGRVLQALPRHDCVQLRRMPAQVGGAPNPLLGLSRHPCPEEEVGHRVPLDTLRGLAHGPLREAAKKRRRLARSHRVELVADGDAQAAFDALVGWKRSQYPGGLLDDARVVDFYRGLLGSGGLARLFRLCVDGAVVAAQYAVVSGGGGQGAAGGRTCVGLITGYDPAWHAVSPGKLLTAALLEHLRGEGFAAFDAGRGREAYKADYGGAWQPLYRHGRAATPVGLAFLAAQHAARRAGARLLPRPHRPRRAAPSAGRPGVPAGPAPEAARPGPARRWVGWAPREGDGPSREALAGRPRACSQGASPARG